MYAQASTRNLLGRRNVAGLGIYQPGSFVLPTATPPYSIHVPSLGGLGFDFSTQNLVLMGAAVVGALWLFGKRRRR